MVEVCRIRNTLSREAPNVKELATSLAGAGVETGVEVYTTLIRLPDKRPKRSNEEFRKVGKEARKFILPAFLPSSFIFCQETG